jgi:hypothetical protein
VTAPITIVPIISPIILANPLIMGTPLITAIQPITRRGATTVQDAICRRTLLSIMACAIRTQRGSADSTNYF